MPAMVYPWSGVLARVRSCCLERFTRQSTTSGGDWGSSHARVFTVVGAMSECHVCGEDVPVDGEQAIERFGEVLCRDCSDNPVVFVAECTNELCMWSHRVEDREFNR